MTPEIIVIIAVFISGGALGAAGALLGQWVLKKVQDETPQQRRLESGDFDLLRNDLAELSRKVHQVDVRLDFTEQLLGALQVGQVRG